MSDKIDPMDFPQAVPVRKKRMRFSVVWIIPLVAAAVALGIAVQSYLSKGPTITIVFKEAEGLEAGKTYVKYKDIHIGQVSKVKLSDDFTKIEVTAKIDKSAENLIVEDSKFWVMRPQVSLSGISGFGTILSGNYIGIDPGKSKKKSKHFTGIEIPPPISSSREPSGKLSRMNPGSLPDWPLSEQKPLFAVLGEGPAKIGVQLKDSFLMVPVKTVSGIFFPAEEKFESCQLCPREKCPGRRAPYDPELYDRKYR